MYYIKNAESLLNGKTEASLRKMALEIIDATIQSCNPGLLTREYVSLNNGNLHVKGEKYDLSRGKRVFVVGAGKATYPIAQALEDVLGATLYKGIVNVKHGEAGSLERIQLRLAGHPTPDLHSLQGTKNIVDLLKEVRSGDIVIACFTGGSSSLFVSPAGNISLEDKAETSKVLLTCGANIIEINKVRKHISTVKGGRLVKNLPAGVNLINLTVSDVIGDALDYITDPSVPDTSTFKDAIATLDKYKLWDKLPFSVTNYLRQSPQENRTQTEADLSHLNMQHIILLSADAACSVAIKESEKRGLTPLLLSSFFEDESKVLGSNFVAIARQIKLSGSPIAAPCCIIGGGETTVTLDGFSGEGGPNQEFTLNAARGLDDLPGVVIAGIDTDGTDGPTQNAGGIVDSGTSSKARSLGINLTDAIRTHNASPALNKLEDAIITGNTGTNVNDLKLMIVG